MNDRELVMNFFRQSKKVKPITYCSMMMLVAFQKAKLKRTRGSALLKVLSKLELSRRKSVKD